MLEKEDIKIERVTVINCDDKCFKYKSYTDYESDTLYSRTVYAPTNDNKEWGFITSVIDTKTNKQRIYEQDLSIEEKTLIRDEVITFCEEELKNCKNKRDIEILKEDIAIMKDIPVKETKVLPTIQGIFVIDKDCEFIRGNGFAEFFVINLDDKKQYSATYDSLSLARVDESCLGEVSLNSNKLQFDSRTSNRLLKDFDRLCRERYNHSAREEFALEREEKENVMLYEIDDEMDNCY